MTAHSSQLPAFDLFVGIDWSGAKGPRLGGLQVAICRPGSAAPELMPGPANGYWTRRQVYDYLRAQQAAGERVLAGIDFAFAYPHADQQAYFPGLSAQVASAAALWALVDDICVDADDFYGGPFYRRQELPYHQFLNAPGHRGEKFQSRRRITEQHCRRITAPSPVFNCVGPAGVGIGSLAGMRLLHALGQQQSAFAAWPFAAPQSLTVVEIFPRLYFKLVGADPRGWHDVANVNAALAGWQSAPLAAGVTISREDHADALVSAAALRGLAERPAVWRAADHCPPAKSHEGWIFGVE